MTVTSITWLILLIAFLVIEAGTVLLVSIWFAVGALAALICSLLGGELWLQGVLFFVVSAGMLAALRPISRKLLKPKIEKTNVDSVVGSTGKVILQIDNDNASGQVKLGAMEWTARSSSGVVIPVGTLIRVDKVEGVKVYVSPVEVKETVTN